MIRLYPLCRSIPQQIIFRGFRSSLPCLFAKNQISASYPMALATTDLTSLAPNSDSLWIALSNPSKLWVLSGSNISCSIDCSPTPVDLFLSPAYRSQAHIGHGSTNATSLLTQTECLSPNFSPLATLYSSECASQEFLMISQSTSNKSLFELDERRYFYLSGWQTRHICKN